MSLGTHATGAIAAVVIGFGAVLPLSVRTVPIVIEQAEVTTAEVVPGGDLSVRFVVDRQEVCPTTATPTIFDGAGYEWKIPEDSRPAFGPETTEVKLVHYTVPPGAVPGVGRYRLVLSFECNWTQRLLPLTLVLPDIPFIIKDE